MRTIDSELHELLRQRPDLLRIAEAVVDTQAPARRRTARAPRYAIAFGLVVAGVVAALVTSWPRSGPGVVDRALAAIGSGPIIHAVVSYPTPDDAVVQLGTGAARPRIRQTEYWYDAERKLLHTRLLTDGKMLTEIVETPNGSDSDLGHYPGGFAAQLDPALAGFVTRYRDSLAAGTAKIVGHQQVDGRDATLLRITLDSGVTEDVAVDSESYRPLFFRVNPPPGVGVAGTIPVWHVAKIESVPREASYFAKPSLSAPRPTGGRGSETTTITLEQAGTALERPALWLGERFEGLPFAGAESTQVHVDYTDGSTHDGTSLQLTYGTESPVGKPGTSAPWLTIGEAASVAGSYGLGFNDGGDPPAPPASMVLSNFGGERAVRGPRPWVGRLIVDGVYVQLTGSSRELVLGAARSLKRL
jgi:hypothetical protein